MYDLGFYTFLWFTILALFLCSPPIQDSCSTLCFCTSPLFLVLYVLLSDTKSYTLPLENASQTVSYPRVPGYEAQFAFGVSWRRKCYSQQNSSSTCVCFLTDIWTNIVKGTPSCSGAGSEEIVGQLRVLCVLTSAIRWVSQGTRLTEFCTGRGDRICLKRYKARWNLDGELLETDATILQPQQAFRKFWMAASYTLTKDT